MSVLGSLRLASVLCLLGTAACATQSRPHSSPPAGTVPTLRSGSPAATASPDCPQVRPTRGYASVDFVDFVHLNGRDFISGLDAASRRPPRPAELGAVVIRVRCSFSQFNERTGKMPGPARDGDAAFLKPGTPVYSVSGWSPECRVAARRDSRLYLYLAYRNGGAHAEPLACATQAPH